MTNNERPRGSCGLPVEICDRFNDNRRNLTCGKVEL